LQAKARQEGLARPLAIYRGAIDADQQAATPQVTKKLIKQHLLKGP
jgi:hypothetical protein